MNRQANPISKTPLPLGEGSEERAGEGRAQRGFSFFFFLNAFRRFTPPSPGLLLRCAKAQSTLSRGARVFCAALAITFIQTVVAQNIKPSTRFEKAIEKFEESDKKNPPKKNGILFVGSSSIRMWKLDKSFPKLKTINRGFGGSYVRDSIYFADRIILPYEPRIMALYAGDNDINAGMTPKQVYDDYVKLVTKIRSNLPKTRIVYIAIKPSISRWKLVGKMREANTLIRKRTEKEKFESFADIDTPMIGKDGKPMKDLFIKDGLHLSDKGYAMWTKVMEPLLQDKPAPPTPPVAGKKKTS